MSSESINLGQITSPYLESRSPVSPGATAPETKRNNPSTESSTSTKAQAGELNPTQVTEVLADQAMEKLQNAQQESSDLSTDDLKDMLEEVNNLLYSMNRALRFEVHDKTEDLIVRVVNTRTDEVIRQYPREDVIERREKLLQGELGAFSTQVK